MEKYYGKELILDLHECNQQKFKRRTIKKFFIKLCNLIDMQRAELYWWDDYSLPVKERQTEPHLKGTSAVQFIMTSNITIHTLDILKSVYLNIFSCKDFNANEAAEFSRKFFEGRIASKIVVNRK
ncbi:MAG: hypothetical protein A3H02_00125 [Candidatus Niyogibacteria bacterium RIFCSPLOWO2_12_FULL_41_13]|uniref:S-adenosylmethionine decarboxylase n=1 Tax=Candidatus Niyogibacteria bacterium RIFCSPLOWO2_12_FULL_41_13 TaxID=1801726 RepID=A0A1G2F3M2_9BACT|nr:MAG: hypothetical protein A3H02_00125 [Candidatus Niyogibacteria bacterium RIFCSPLOWO2_12_FULL_41_13]